MESSELTYPLISRAADAPMAIIGSSAPQWVIQWAIRTADEPPLALGQSLGQSIDQSAGPFSKEKSLRLVPAKLFLAQVAYLADQLPEHSYVINLCENRYVFALVFCAAILKGQINLLPPNKKPLTQQRMLERYGDVYLAHDSVLDDALSQAIPRFDLHGLHGSHLSPIPLEGKTFEIPAIPLKQLAAISFTSGSTGDSQPNLKSWQTVVESTRINAQHMLAGMDKPLYQLATVPAQHMWGLETSILLALFDEVCLFDGKPLFPQDISDGLCSLPEPRMLVSTPVHLRALAASSVQFPAVSLLLCATSPLPKALAALSESRFSSDTEPAHLREVYGCSEVGSMACRRSAEEDEWQLFDGIQLTLKEGETFASTAYLPDAIRLQDRIHVLQEGRFTLGGRDSDMVDIAGKRGSLLELNKVLLNYPDLLDGAIFMPDMGSQAVSAPRLAAMVVFKGAGSVADLRNYFSKHVDSAFIPRPILAVQSLPREENGKLPRSQLQAYYQQIRDR